MPPGTDLTYTWAQAQSDLGQIAPIVALTGFFLLAIIADLVLPRSRRGGVVAMFAVVGFADSPAPTSAPRRRLPSTCWSAGSRARSCFTGWRSSTAARGRP